MTGETFATAADLFAAEDASRGGRKLDENATRRAQARQEVGATKLRRAFGVLTEPDDEGNVKPPPPKVWAVLLRAADVGDPSGRGTPVRLKPGTPPVRDAEHQAKHRRRKAQRAARRRNRGA